MTAALDDGQDFLVEGFSPIAELNALIPWGDTPSEAGNVTNVSFGYQSNVRLFIEYLSLNEQSAWAIFDEPVSFRVHDEGEIYCYWGTRSYEGVRPGFAFEIERSHYLTEMRLGATAIMNQKRRLRHFLICGLNICVEVIAFEPPTVTFTNPSRAQVDASAIGSEPPPAL